MAGQPADVFQWADDDDLDLIKDVERAFGVSITDREAAATQTAGDLEALLITKTQAGDRTMACASQAAFFRLRAALRSIRPALRLTLDLPLEQAIRSRRDWKQVMGLVGAEVNLSAKPWVWVAWSLWACATLSGFVVSADRGRGLLLVIACGICSALCLAALYRSLPLLWVNKLPTAREFARTVGIGAMRKFNPNPSRTDVWRTIQALTKDFHPRGGLHRSTRFWPEKG